jgi:hypothetical protein
MTLASRIAQFLNCAVLVTMHLLSTTVYSAHGIYKNCQICCQIYDIIVEASHEIHDTTQKSLSAECVGQLYTVPTAMEIVKMGDCCFF